MKGTVVRAAVTTIDSISNAINHDETPAHLKTGRAGEEAAYFHLRKLGYVIIARNWRVPQCKGELDLVGWDGDTLCFVEVKTRTTHDIKPAEAAVDDRKRRELALMAGHFLRRMPIAKAPAHRFDIVSIYFSERPAEITLFKNVCAVP